MPTTIQGPDERQATENEKLMSLLRRRLTSRHTGTAPSEPAAPRAVPQPTIALALGGGGARGLAHALMLEAFDELGIRPKVIAGTSIGAIYGAAYASGLSGREISAHTRDVLGARFDLLKDLVNARGRGFSRVWNLFGASPALLDPVGLLDIILPKGVARDFARLPIPLKLVASDFYRQEPVVFTSGPLQQAIAASMALPVIFDPVIVDGRALIDGGLTNPLPFDLLFGEADVVVAIDVTGAPTPNDKRPHPTAFEALMASSFLFERSIIRAKLAVRQPDVYIEAGTSSFQVLDFLRVSEILAAAEPAKARLKAQLARVLGAETIEDHSAAPAQIAAAPRQGQLGPHRSDMD